MSPRKVGGASDDGGGASPGSSGALPDIRTAIKTIKDAMPGTKELVNMGGELVTKRERLKRIGELTRVATQMASQEWEDNRRFWIVECLKCGDVFIRSSGPNGYGGKSTWKGRCPMGHKNKRGNLLKDDGEHSRMIGEAVPQEAST